MPPMHRSAPMTVGARVGLRRPAPEAAQWLLNVPDKAADNTTPPAAPAETDERIQIGPLDV